MNLNKFLFSLLIILNASFLLAQETVVFRTDRDTYIAGESVWISASCLKSGTSDLSNLSKVIYIEVLNNKNVPEIQLKLNLENGSAATQFELPGNLKTGNYLIRGYTKWMRNYNPEFFFTKNIAIINPFSSNSFPQKENAYLSDTLIFYPEGGKIIRNRSNKIIAQSFDKFGNYKSISGEVFSPSGEKVFEIETSENGLVEFNLNPKESGEYHFLIVNNNKKNTVPLGNVLVNGINLQLVEENDELTFKLSVAEEVNNSSINGSIDIVSPNGDIIESHPILLKHDETVSLNTATLLSNYLSALLLDENKKILSSRYFTISKTNAAEQINVESDKKIYSTRTPVSVKIEAFNKLKNVSVSVVKESLMNYKTQIGKTARPGNIPKQFIDQLAKDGIAVNDLLLCFNPVDTVKSGGSEFLFLPEMKGEIISGTIVNQASQQAIVNQVFALSFVGKHPTINITETDSLGKFYFESKRFGEQEIVIQPFSRDSINLNYKVNLDLAFSTKYSNYKVHPLFLEAKNVEKINQAIVNMQVDALYKPFNSYPFLSKAEFDPECFYGKPEISIKTDDFIELPTMEEIFREIVPNTQLVKKEGKFSIKITEIETLSGTGKNSFCMVDGVPIRNQHNIFEIRPQEVEKIDVINSDFFIRNYKISNLLNVTTKKGDMSAFEFDSRLFRQAYNGFAPTYFFNGPDYSVDSLINSRIPDFRNLIYWNPNVVFNDENETNISFFTSDENAEYVIVVEGINSEGVMERKLISFDVKKETIVSE